MWAVVWLGTVNLGRRNLLEHGVNARSSFLLGESNKDLKEQNKPMNGSSTRLKHDALYVASKTV